MLLRSRNAYAIANGNPGLSQTQDRQHRCLGKALHLAASDPSVPPRAGAGTTLVNTVMQPSERERCRRDMRVALA